jgi:hypothetical protein
MRPFPWSCRRQTTGPVFGSTPPPSSARLAPRDPKRVVLVAQSLAGFTAPLVCEDVRVALLVLVNAMIPRPGETPGEWWGNTGHREAKRQQNLRDGRAADGSV